MTGHCPVRLLLQAQIIKGPIPVEHFMGVPIIPVISGYGLYVTVYKTVYGIIRLKREGKRSPASIAFIDHVCAVFHISRSRLNHNMSALSA